MSSDRFDCSRSRSKAGLKLVGCVGLFEVAGQQSLCCRMNESSPESSGTPSNESKLVERNAKPMLVWPLPRVMARSAKAGPNVSLAIETSPVIESVVKLKPPDDEPRGKDSSCAPSSTFICRAETRQALADEEVRLVDDVVPGCVRLIVDSWMTRLTRPASGPCAAATRGHGDAEQRADDSRRPGRTTNI